MTKLSKGLSVACVALPLCVVASSGLAAESETSADQLWCVKSLAYAAICIGVLVSVESLLWPVLTGDPRSRGGGSGGHSGHGARGKRRKLSRETAA